MDENCQFCRIANKKQDAFIVFENEKLISFLDVRPVFLGHCLLIPKAHYQTLYDAPDTLINDLFIHTKLIGKAIEKSMQAEGSFMAVNNIVSQSVPHLHIHIVPRNKGDGLKGFFWPRQKYKDNDEMKEIQSIIIKNLVL